MEQSLLPVDKNDDNCLLDETVTMGAHKFLCIHKDFQMISLKLHLLSETGIIYWKNWICSPYALHVKTQRHIYGEKSNNYQIFYKIKRLRRKIHILVKSE